MTEDDRPEMLTGPTYEVRYELEHGTNKPLYVTVNQLNGKPVELLARCDEAEMFEWVALAMVQSTRLLTMGVPLLEVARDMQEIHSPRTAHHIPGGGGRCPSIAARIGKVLEQHVLDSEGGG